MAGNWKIADSDAGGGFGRSPAGPTIPRAHLPAVHGAKRLLLFGGEGGAQQHRQLAQRNEDVVVADGEVQPKQLHHTVRHEGDGGSAGGGRELGARSVRAVHP